MTGLVALTLLIGLEPTANAPIPPPRCAIECDFGAAFELLGRSRGGLLDAAPIAASSGLARACPAMGFVSGVAREAVETALRSDETAGADPATFRFAELCDAAANERATRILRATVDALVTRRDLIERRVSSLLPESAPRVVLPVVFVLGMPRGFTQQAFDEAGQRAVLVDAIGLAERVGAERPDLRDAIGEQLALSLPPELFFAAYREIETAQQRAHPQSELARLQRVLLVEGIADHLGRTSDERYDGERRHAPLVDANARDAFDALERHLLAILDPATPPEQRAERIFAFNNGPREERYGVVAGSFMVDAIVRFSGSRRLQGVLAAGPSDLARAYAEVCSGHAAIPRLGQRITSLLATDLR